jgi:site-specific recombinase XerD
VAREIPLEKKGIQAIRNWLAARPTTPHDELSLNSKGQPIGGRGVRFLVQRYRVSAGITKKPSCHSFRHTLASARAELELYKSMLDVSFFHIYDYSKSVLTFAETSS